jgi:hypothetical protein
MGEDVLPFRSRVSCPFSELARLSSTNSQSLVFKRGISFSAWFGTTDGTDEVGDGDDNEVAPVDPVATAAAADEVGEDVVGFECGAKAEIPEVAE